jgi:1A family penicillin-binding protein
MRRFLGLALSRIDDIGAYLRQQPRAARTVVATVAAISWVIIIGLTWFSIDLIRSTPRKKELVRVGDMARATTLIASDGRPAFTIFKEQRIEVPLAQVSPLLVKAVVAVEDQRFYEHRGVDLIRIAGSALANVREGRRAQGASTITQQLARQSFLTRDKTIRRKLQEVIVASELESEYSKDQILELYLNKVYFGDGLHGVEAASRGFFGKHASELTLSEAALIAGLVKSPSAYAPTANMSRAVARRAVVLQAMVDAGAITQADAGQARQERVLLHDGLARDDPRGAWFKEEVRRELVARFGLARVYEGGLKVYTTIDLEMQQAADDLTARAIGDIENRRAKRRRNQADDDDAPLQGALLAMDPATGEVRALVGGRDFAESRFDRAVQAHRQPGSAFKPFVYATALEQGWAPASIIDRLDEPVQTLQGAWMPEDEHLDSPELTLRTALRTSSNRAAVRLLQEVGIDKTVDMARRLGLGQVPSVPSLALGSGEVTLEDLTAAYAAFAARGVYHAPVLIRRVEDVDGTVLFEANTTGTRVVSEDTAFLLTSMLSDVVNAGTAWKARLVGFTLPAAGKTGTTNDYDDAWFVGYTPKLVTGVWIGFDQPKTIVAGGYAGDVAVPLWGQFMKVATHGDTATAFAPPKGLVAVQVCRLSGKLPASGCEDVEVVSDKGEMSHRSLIYTDYFPRGAVPSETCPLHQASLLNRLAGLFKNGHVPTAPVPASAVGVPPRADAGVAEAVARGNPATAIADQPEPAMKKRGFWGRLFGRREKPEPAQTAPKEP